MSPLNLGARLRELRQARGLSQPELASILGINSTTISRWETNRSDGYTRGDMLERLAAALKVKPDQIAGPPKTTPRIPEDDFNKLQAQLDRIEQTLDDFTGAWAEQALPLVTILRAEAEERHAAPKSTRRKSRAKSSRRAT